MAVQPGGGSVSARVRYVCEDDFVTHSILVWGVAIWPGRWVEEQRKGVNYIERLGFPIIFEPDLVAFAKEFG